MLRIIGRRADAKCYVNKKLNSNFRKKTVLYLLTAVLSLTYWHLFVVMLCCKSGAIKVDVRLCLANKNVDKMTVGGLPSTGLEFSITPKGTRLR